MAEEVTLSELISIISKLQVNYTFLAKSWYDIFYNSKAIEKVAINYYDDSGRLQQDTIPNLAYARQYFIQEEGDPNGVVSAKVGTIYQDTASGEAYIKHSGEDDSTNGWIKFISTNDLERVIIQGSKTPEGRVVAAPGTLYIDQDENRGTLYMKRSTTGNTGWERIDSYPTSFGRQVFNVEQGTEKVQISMRVENDTLVNVFVDGTLLSHKKYRLQNDNRTIEFGYYDSDNQFTKAPLESVDTEESIEVIVQYYTDIHFYDGGVTADYIELLENCTAAAALAETTSVEVVKAAHELEIKIDDAVASAIELAEKGIYEAYKAEADRLEATVDKLDGTITNISNTVKEEYNEIKGWYSGVGQMQASVAAMQKDVATMKSDILNNSHYIWAKSLEEDIMLKSVYVPELQRIEEKIGIEDAALKEEFTNTIARVDTDIANLTSDINNELNQIRVAQSTSESELRSLITTYESTNISEHDELRGAVSTIQNTYYNEKTLPIGIRSIYQYNKDINTDAKSQISKDGIIIDLRRDCFYYTVDLGDIMDALGADVDFDGFEIRPGSTLDSDSTPNLDPVTPEGEMINSDNFTNIMLQARVMFKNESIFKPTIYWSPNTLSWIGGEEPDFEAGKNYLIEFISYDLGGSWYAHTMGVCQPAIRVDDFNALINITLKNHTGDGEFALYYDADKETRIYDGTYDSMNNVISVAKQLSRKYKGTVLKNIRVHQVGVDPAFVKHAVPASAQFTLAEDAVINAEIDWNNVYTDVYSFALTIVAPEIEDYIKQNETVPVVGQTRAKIESYMKDNATTGVRLINLVQSTPMGTYVGTIDKIEDIEIEHSKDATDDPVTVRTEVTYTLDGVTNTVELSNFLADTTLSLQLVSKYYRKATETYECSDLKIKMSFDNGVEYEPTTTAFQGAKYVFDPVNTYNSGLVITFKTNVDTVIMSNSNEATRRVDNMITEVKVNYPALPQESCLVAQNDIQMGLDSSANVILTTVGVF